MVLRMQAMPACSRASGELCEAQRQDPQQPARSVRRILARVDTATLSSWSSSLSICLTMQAFSRNSSTRGRLMRNARASPPNRSLAQKQICATVTFAAPKSLSESFATPRRPNPARATSTISHGPSVEAMSASTAREAEWPTSLLRVVHAARGAEPSCDQMPP